MNDPRLTTEQNFLFTKALSGDGCITMKERLDLIKAGIAAEIIDELTKPDEVGDKTEFSNKPSKSEQSRKEAAKALRSLAGAGAGGVAVGAGIGSFGGPAGAVAGAFIGGLIGLGVGIISSCSKEPPPPDINETNNIYDVDVNIIQKIDTGMSKEELLEVLKEFWNSTEINEIVEALKSINKTTEMIVILLMELGASFDKVIAALETMDTTQQDILNTLSNGNAAILESLQNILNAVNAGTELSAENNKLLAQLLEMVGNIDTGTDPAITNLLEKIFTMLETAINQQNNSDSELQDSLQTLISSVNTILESLQKILDKVNAGTELSAENNKLLAQLLEMVGNINTETDPAITNLLEKIFTMLEMAINQQNNSDSKLQDLLQTLIDKVDAFMQGSQTADEKTLKLLETLIDSINAGNAQNAQFYETILNKLDGLEAVIKDYLMNILDAVNKNGEISEDIRNLTQKVLEQINNHAVADNDALKAILEAINNLSVGTGGNVDLSKIEEMLAALLKQTEENGNLLTDINGKLDVINMTIKAATDEIKNLLGDKFDQNNEYFKQIIDKLEGFGSEGYDDTELLQKLDTILNILGNISDNTNKDDLLSKLDEILAAIKDHKVIVDVTGKITCDCNCGNDQNHEGIVGDLEDLLG